MNKFYLFLFLLCASSLYAQQYYINDNDTTGDIFCTAVGNNANSGLIPAKPKLTFANLLAVYTLKPGDTVYVDTGTYNENVNITDSGNSSSNITFLGAGTNKTIVDAPGTGYGIRINADYVKLQNFAVTGSGSIENGIYLDGAEHCEIISNYSYNHQWQGLKLHHGSKYNLVKDNTFANCTSGIQDLSTEWVAGGYNKLFNNRLYNNDFGIRINPAPGINGCIIMYNEIFNNNNEGVFLEKFNNGVVGNNICYNNGAIGITYKNSTGTVIFNNLCYRNGLSFVGWDHGIDLQAGAAGIIINNTCVKNKGSGIRIQSGSGGTFKNNIVSQNDGTDFKNENAGAITVTYCCVHGTRQNITLGTGCITSDPLFKSVNLSDWNLHLRYNSPAMGKGETNIVPCSMGGCPAWVSIDNPRISLNTAYTVFFMASYTNGSIPSDGRIKITFPPAAGFDISSLDGSSPNTVSSWGGSPGTFSALVSGQTVTITRNDDGGADSTPGQVENLILTGVNNNLVGSNYLVYIETQEADGSVIDFTTSNDFRIWAALTTVITISKSVSNITLNESDSTAIPGATINYRLMYSNTGITEGNKVIIYDEILPCLTYMTNVMGTATGWTLEWSTNSISDQSWDSSDYTNFMPTPKSLIKWVRWRKLNVGTDEDGLTLLFKATID